MITRRDVLRGMAAGLAVASVAASTLIGKTHTDSLWSKAFYPDPYPYLKPWIKDEDEWYAARYDGYTPHGLIPEAGHQS